MKIRTLMLVAIFLIQALLVPIGTEAVVSSLAPSSIINLPDFNKLISAVHTGINIYKMDALGGCSRKELKARCEAIASENPSLGFDIAGMSIGKRGWTRYYSFSIGDKDLIMRIFLTAEYNYQTKIDDEDIILQASREDLRITYQVFRSVNSILKGCPTVKPQSIPDTKYTGKWA